jgi:uncharacterized protein YjbJ (UPF0337 family)
MQRRPSRAYGVRFAARVCTSKQEVAMDDRTRKDRDRDRDMADRGVENQVKGKAKEVEGKVRGKAADLADDTSEQIKGKAQEMKGKIQKNFGNAQERMSDKGK